MFDFLFFLYHNKYMKKYFIALIALSLVFFSYNTFAQLRPITPSILREEPKPDTAIVEEVRRPVPSTVSATVKGAFMIQASDRNKNFKVTVYKLVGGRWVNVNNFSTMVKPTGEYLTVVRGAGTYRFVPSVRFDPKFKYRFLPANHTVVIKEGMKNAVYIRNFKYVRTNRK